MSGGCTLVKPVVGAFTGPVIILGHCDGDFVCGCSSGEAALCIAAGLAVVGAAAGLVTGIVSDVQWACGVPGDPTDNWWDPFVTNTGDGLK
ncbi:MAG: hypothetical protein H6838_04190 [Planctomycetes bacterium]|nr:hypothetical protein [Planctomycetota bacterium]